MVSAIDATKPVDGVAASKADLRENLATAKSEIETLQVNALPNIISDFGAVGDGVTDDSAAIQAAIDTQKVVYFPGGKNYLVNSPVQHNDLFCMVGDNAGAKASTRTRIIAGAGLGTQPMFSRADAYLKHDDTRVDGEGNPLVGNGGGASSLLNITGIRFADLRTTSSGILNFFNTRPGSFIRNCVFEIRSRGCYLSDNFGLGIYDCEFIGNWWGINGSDLTNVDRDFGLYVSATVNVVNCSAAANGVGIHAQGVGPTLLQNRFEANAKGVILGGLNRSWAQIPGGASTIAMARGCFIGGGGEANYIGMEIDGVADSIIKTGMQGSPAGAGRAFDSKIGADIKHAGRSADIDLSLGGLFTYGPCFIKSSDPGNIRVQSSNTDANGHPNVSGSSSIISAQAADLPYYQGSYVKDEERFNVDSHFNLSSISGINLLTNNKKCKRVGNVVTPANAATLVSVSFPNVVTEGSAQFNSVPTAVADVASTLPAGTYIYGSSILAANGETGVNTSSTATTTCREVTVISGEKVALSLFGFGSVPSQRRIYRGTTLGEWDGYFVLSSTVFEDVGQAFDGRDIPPPSGQSIPNLQEEDTDYHIIATPSWGTTVHVSNKSATGFDLNFGMPAPTANESVSWIMFRI